MLKKLDELQVDCESTDKAVYCLLRGRALNITDKYNEKAFELLSRSVKLKPQLTEAWNQLGECFWKKGDNQSALNCFESALKHEVNKISLRNASMVLRQLGNTAEEKDTNLLKSLEKAKQSLECDISDGISWYILGNAYLTLFFRTQTKRDSSLLNACKAAYLKAFNHKIAKSQTDFLFNYGTVLQYEEEFLKSLECLQRAVLLDPEWKEPFERKNSIITYLKDCCEMCDKKASLKARRIHSFIEGLAKDLKLKIYENRKFAKFSQLSVGPNTSIDLISKVIACINNSSAMAQTYCIIDCDKQCIILLIYNLSPDSGPKLGDTLVIEKPLVKSQDFCFDGISYQFKSIRIENPLNLIINNRKISKESIVLPKVDNFLKND